MILRLGKWVLKISLRHYVFVNGIRSVCEDGKHVLFLDFDNIALCAVEAVCRILQLHFRCGDFLIFESSKNSFHVICIDKFSMLDCVKLQEFAGCDRTFISFSLRRRFWVLRFSAKGHKKKPALVRVLYNRGIRHRSSAHARFLNLYSDSKLSLKGDDKCKDIMIHRYATLLKHQKNH